MSKRKAVNAQDEWKQNPMQAVNNHKFLNDPDDAVVESLLGFVQAHPNCQLLDGLPDVKVVVRANTLLSNVDKNKVALISGGGSGHEPAHAGFVGEGMLNAAVCGDVFASPRSRRCSRRSGTCAARTVACSSSRTTRATA